MGVPVVRPEVTETTALGAAYLAGLATGVWSATDELDATVARRAPLRADDAVPTSAEALMDAVAARGGTVATVGGIGDEVRAPVIERAALLAALRDSRPWDVLVIGGGATGLGIAVDAASRGLRTALIEARDFSSGTSSRSTKLIHGGVRYLAQGNVKLVREALIERALLLANAPALVRPMEFIVPCYRPLEREFMRVGLGLYDGLAGTRGIGPTRWLSRAETLARLPTVRHRRPAGGVSYWDAQFDDARLAIALMRTACRLGATAINYVRADSLRVNAGSHRGRARQSMRRPTSASNCAPRSSTTPPASGSIAFARWPMRRCGRSSRSAVARTSSSTHASCPASGR